MSSRKVYTDLTGRKTRFLFSGQKNRFQFEIKAGSCALCGTESCILPNYFICNIIATVLHFVQAIIIMIITLSQRIDISIPTREQYTTWEQNKQSIFTTTQAPTNTTTTQAPTNTTNTTTTTTTTQAPIDSMDIYFGDMVLRTETVLTKSSVSIAWIVISFFLLSALFQGLALLESYNYKKRKDNWLRFVEYTFSASIMLVAIALINGIFDQTVIVFIAVTCAACQLCGLIAEQLLNMSKNMSKNTSLQTFQETLFILAWVAHGIGWLLVGTSYYFILHFYMLSNEKSSTEAPEFVTVIVFSILGLFASFGFVQLLQMTSTIDFAQAEFTYVILSLTAKSILGWIIYANVLLVG